MLERGWIVVSLEHRLCPQVNILDGPIADARDCLDWVLDGSLEKELGKTEVSLKFKVDYDRIVAVGTSSGGTLALALVSTILQHVICAPRVCVNVIKGFGVKQKVAAILDFYGATNFSNDFWSSPLPNEKAPDCPPKFIEEVYAEKPIPIRGGVSLEGQAPVPGRLSARGAFTLMNLANGRLMDVCFPSKKFKNIDACLNIDGTFPPTCIVHGTMDTKVPILHSRVLFTELQKAGVECKFIEVPDEEHTFVGQMKKGSRTWEIQRAGFDWLESQIKTENIEI